MYTVVPNIEQSLLVFHTSMTLVRPIDKFQMFENSTSTDIMLVLVALWV